MGDYKFADDFWASMQAEEKMSHRNTERHASVNASLDAINKFSSFIMQGETQEERDLRLDLVDKDVRRVSELFAEKYDVEVEPVYSFAKAKLAENTAVTEPKTIDPEKPIGEISEEGGEERFADALTDVNSLEAVLVDEDGLDEVKRHKRERVDLNKDTQKAPKASAVDKTAAEPYKQDYGFGPVGGPDAWMPDDEKWVDDVAWDLMNIGEVDEKFAYEIARKVVDRAKSMKFRDRDPMINSDTTVWPQADGTYASRTAGGSPFFDENQRQQEGVIEDDPFVVGSHFGLDPNEITLFAEREGLSVWDAAEELASMRDEQNDSYDDYYDGPGEYELYGPDRPLRPEGKRKQAMGDFPDSHLEENDYSSAHNNLIDDLHQLLLETEEPQNRQVIKEAIDRLSEMGRTGPGYPS